MGSEPLTVRVVHTLFSARQRTLSTPGVRPLPLNNFNLTPHLEEIVSLYSGWNSGSLTQSQGSALSVVSTRRALASLNSLRAAEPTFNDSDANCSIQRCSLDEMKGLRACERMIQVRSWSRSLVSRARKIP